MMDLLGDDRQIFSLDINFSLIYYAGSLSKLF